MNSIETLRQIANAYKTTPRKCAAYDPNTYDPDEGVADNSSASILPTGEPLSYDVRFISGRRRLKLSANAKYLRLIVPGTFPFRPCSINAIERGGFRSEFAGDIPIGSRRYPVFTENGELSASQRSFLSDSVLAQLFTKQPLKEGESVHPNTGDITTYLVTPDLERVVAFINSLGNIADRLDASGTDSSDLALPQQFTRLIPLIQKWAVGDDVDRQLFLQNAPTTALKDLVMQVEPYIQAINSYLDESESESSDTTVALGRLAEVTSEAKIEIEARQRQPRR